MTTTVRIIATGQSATTMPEDDFVNVFHFRSLLGDDGDNIVEMFSAIGAFYANLEDLYNVNTVTGSWDLKAYDLLDPPPRVPVATQHQSLVDLSDADALPTECAIVLSFQGDAESGVNLRRRRGRLFLGPLSNGVATTISGFVRITAVAQDLVAAAGDDLMNAGGANWQWSVFSPTTAGAPPWDATALAESTFRVTSGYCDDAFDTQRRRGTAPLTRVSFP